MLLEMLKESSARKWVQFGTVEAIRDVDLNGTKDKLVIINYQGEHVYCQSKDFEERNVSSLNGFMHTKVPFIVKEIKDESFVRVSRVDALERVAKDFVENAREGDLVKGTVTGVNDNDLVFLEVKGYPCIIPPGQWDIRSTSNLRELLPIGTTVEAKVLSIDPLEDKDVRVDHRVRLSRKELVIEQMEERWDSIHSAYQVGDNVAVKITGQANGYNSYFCELPNGISIIGNLTNPLRNKYNDYLPPGVQATGEIKSLDKENRRGKMIIRRVEPNHASLLQGQTFGAL